MLFIYNELDTPVWTLEKNDNGHYKMVHGFSPMMNVGFSAENNPNTIEHIGEVFKSTTEKFVCADSTYTEMGFSSRTGSPYISKITSETTPYKRNVVFASLDLDSQTLLNVGIKKGRVYVQKLDTDSKTFSIIFDLDTDPENRAACFIISRDVLGGIRRMMFGYNKETDQGNVFINTYNNESQIKTNQNGRKVIRLDDMVFDNEKGEKELFFTPFRPRRPATNVICTEPDDVDHVKQILTEQYKYDPESNRIILHTPTDKKELKKKINFLTSRGILYVTYYLPDISVEDLRKPEIVNKLRSEYFSSNFNHVSVLRDDGNIIHVY